MKVDTYRCGENSRMYAFYVRKFSSATSPIILVYDLFSYDEL